MSAELVSVPAPICEVCWIAANSTWEPESIDEEGHMLVALVDVSIPKKYNLEEPETCYKCGSMTVAGIFDTTSGSFKWFSGHIFFKDEDGDGGYEDDWSEEQEEV